MTCSNEQQWAKTQGNIYRVVLKGVVSQPAASASPGNLEMSRPPDWQKQDEAQLSYFYKIRPNDSDTQWEHHDLGKVLKLENLGLGLALPWLCVCPKSQSQFSFVNWEVGIIIFMDPSN